jgi:RNA polymerase sigma factor (sigma-70 family)
MRAERIGSLQRNFGTLFALGAAGALSDQELLDRFLVRRGDVAEAAFSVLLNRHGPMVLHVCRRVLSDAHDAEDAFQATFLILARRAGSVRHYESLGGWLHEVALRVSSSARTGVARRRKHERRAAENRAGRDSYERSRGGDNVGSIIHREINRLPDGPRAAVVLCYLEGLTHDAAARQLGWPVGTVSTRLSWARRRLRERLLRRGIAPAVVAAWVSTAEVQAISTPIVRDRLAEATLRAATCGRLSHVAAGVVVSDSVAHLTQQGIVQTMIRVRTELLAATAACLVGIALAAAFLPVKAHDPPSGSQELPSSVVGVKLVDGTAVEVIGVSPSPSGPTTWIRPDGSPLADAPCDPLPRPAQFSDFLSGSPAARGSGSTEGDLREVLIRVTGLAPDAAFEWHPRNCISQQESVTVHGGKPAPELRRAIARFPKGLAFCAVHFEFASGVWTTEAPASGDRAILFGTPRALPDGAGTAVSIAHNLVDRDTRIVAIDRAGKIRAPASLTWNGSGTLKMLDVRFRQAPDEIREYRLQSRPFHTLEIPRVALRPASELKAAPRSTELPNSAPAPSSHKVGTTSGSAQPSKPTPATSALAPITTPDVDSDGDGLSDFQEIHKYKSDPHKASTAGDGVSDGDWDRRREFAYTVRLVLRVMPPLNEAILSDDYQDARVIGRGENYVDLEVIHYPLNTVAAGVTGDPDWRSHTAKVTEYLKPGTTTNWDESMRVDLLAALRADGIDPDKLDDRTLVTQAARWLLGHSNFTNMFCTHYVVFPDGRPTILPGLEGQFERDKGDPTWSVQDQFEHELFGRSMFARRSHGTCTSTAVLLTTVLRALGIPTRMILAIPPADGNEPSQLELARSGLHHHRVRQAVEQGIASTRGYANHTFNEVFVGGRWVRLNYTTLAQNSLDPQYMGLLTRANTFNDLSDANLAPTWGRRYALGERDANFPTPNPYKALSISDQFGRYAEVENPEVAEHKFITLTKAYWLDGPETAQFIRNGSRKPTPGAGHLLVHGDEWFADQPYAQYKQFLARAGEEFRFRAKDLPEIRGRLSSWYFTNPPDVREVEIVIPPDQFAKMAPGVDYTIEPVNEKPNYTWRVRDGVAIRRPATSEGAR